MDFGFLVKRVRKEPGQRCRRYLAGQNEEADFDYRANVSGALQDQEGEVKYSSSGLLH